MKKQRLLLAIGICGMIGFLAPALYGSSQRTKASISNNSWSPIPFPCSPILVPLEGTHRYAIDISLSDSDSIIGNYTIYFDEELILTEYLDRTANYDESGVQVTQYHYYTPDHNVTLNLTFSITSGASGTVRITKDWSIASDVWMAIEGGTGIGFLIFLIVVVGSFYEQRKSKAGPPPAVVNESSSPAQEIFAIFCSNCGTKLAVAGDRCPTCGQKITHP